MWKGETFSDTKDLHAVPDNHCWDEGCSKGHLPSVYNGPTNAEIERIDIAVFNAEVRAGIERAKIQDMRESDGEADVDRLDPANEVPR